MARLGGSGSAEPSRCVEAGPGVVPGSVSLSPASRRTHRFWYFHRRAMDSGRWVLHVIVFVRKECRGSYSPRMM